MPTLREVNARRNLSDYAERHVVCSGMPSMIYVELTQNCNQACRMCRAGGLYDPSLDMRPELFQQLATELFQYAQVVDLRGWGESTILVGFRDRLRTALESGARVRLVTNGSAMTDELWEMLFGSDSIVAVSLDTASPELYAELGRGNLDRVVRNLRTGVAIRRRSGRGLLYLNVVVSSLTLSGVPNIVGLAADIGLTKIVLNPIRGERNRAIHLCHRRQEIPAVLDEVARLSLNLGVKVHMAAALDESLAISSALFSVCSNPWTHVFVDCQGGVSYCDHLVRHPELVVGRLSESPFAGIWNGPGFKRIRAQHVAAEKKRALAGDLSVCDWCYRNRYLEADCSVAAPVNGCDREVSTETGPLYRISAAAWPGGGRRLGADGPISAAV